MDNKIKQELNNIDIPTNLHERLQQGVQQAKAEQPKRTYKKPLITVAAIFIIGFGMLLTPVGLAAIQGLFEVKNAQNENISYSYLWEATTGDDVVTYDSLEDMKSSHAFSMPFPDQLLAKEENAQVVNYGTRIDKNGQFLSYQYFVMTADKAYDIIATNVIKTLPTFKAETTDGTATEKEVFVNGRAATLVGVKDIQSYSLYLEQEQWHFVISSFNLEIQKEDLSAIIEQELIQIAESIR